MAEFEVGLQRDFVERQTSASPARAISELIWNAFDGDASSVIIRFEKNQLGEVVDRIIIKDDGDGFSHNDAIKSFRNLGGSWKFSNRVTRRLGRAVHGKNGQGRYKALSLGEFAHWNVVFKDEADGTLKEFSIALKLKSTKVTISDPVPTEKATGVEVIIDNVGIIRPYLNPDALRNKIAQGFAPYMREYPDVSIVFGSEVFNPSDFYTEKPSIQLSPINIDGKDIPATFRVLEWTIPVDRKIYLCDEASLPLGDVTPGLHVGSFQYTGYLASQYIRELSDQNSLSMSEMDEKLVAALDEAKSEIKRNWREKNRSRAATFVQSLKNEKVYPYPEEVKDDLEEAERKIFDILAASINQYSATFEGASLEAKRLQLQTLQGLLTESPGELQRILTSVIQLPAKAAKELASLLNETSLSHIIASAKEVSERLDFVEGLSDVVFKPKTKKLLKERTQLHKIVERNLWVFGNEFDLWVSDKGLTKVLEQYRDRLDPDVVIDKPVKAVGQKTAIVDLVLSKQSQIMDSTKVENLVIELKRPSHPLSLDDRNQIERYMLAVRNDDRFKSVKARWEFILVGNSLKNELEQSIAGGPDPENRVLIQQENFRLRVLTWGEIFAENKGRLAFFKHKLGLQLNDGDSAERLSEKYGEFLDGVFADEEVPNSSETEFVE